MSIDPRDRAWPRRPDVAPLVSVQFTDHEDARCGVCNKRSDRAVCRGCERDMAESYREARSGY